MSVTENKKKETSTEPDFVLKHRVAGAAFLLFFSALLLPWLLGSPTHPNKLSGDAVASDQLPDAKDSVDNDLLAAIAGEASNNVEQVYISKITPLDAKRKGTQKKADVQVAQAQSIETLEKEVPVKTQANKKDSAKVTSSNTTAKKETKKAPVKKEVKTVVKTKKTPVKAKKPEVVKKVDVGWAVQVGVFTDKKGVSKVLKDLKSKGFKPSTTTVDTNLGKGTGTRIWLGPYAQRVGAAKAKSQLTAKTGEAGFIRAYP